MQIATRLISTGKFLGIVAVLACWFLAFPTPAQAQGAGAQGQNAVYSASGTCCQGSSAFIDASMFTSSQSPNICAVLNYVLTHNFPASGMAIDARGLNPNNTSMTCTASPWAGITSPPPSTILLPSGTIVIPSVWVLPNNTHLIGEGDNDPYSSPPGTTIQACKQSANSCTFSGTDMIDLGNSAVCDPIQNAIAICNVVSVERLTLDGQGQTVNGIVNSNAQTGTFVDHVSLYRILGTGLSVSGTANNSGPYSNITFDTGSATSLSSTVCASINGLSSTRGIHGLSCSSESNIPLAAVLLDSSSNSIHDVRIAGFYDGIRVGANANAQSNVLVNITGDTTGTGTTPIIVVHITNSHTVSDLSIMGVNNAQGSSGTITIKDDLTSTSLTNTSVGIYALGESASGGYSRYTTTTGPNAVTWSVGNSAPPTNSSCISGSLYSCANNNDTSGTNCNNANNTPTAFWGCSGGAWKPIM
jgi:hypothetical protein